MSVRPDQLTASDDSCLSPRAVFKGLKVRPPPSYHGGGERLYPTKQINWESGAANL